MSQNFKLHTQALTIPT